MADDLLFTVVMPTYNRGGLIVRALESVCAQQLQEYEVVIVDDGSVDDTTDRVQPFLNQKVRYVKHQENRGVSAARNSGIRAARGHWIVFFDSDNILLPSALSDISRSGQILDENIGCIFARSVTIEGVPLSPPVIPERFAYQDYLVSEFGEALGIVRRDLALRFPFDENLGSKRECSGLFWLVIGKAGFEFRWVDQVVQRYESVAPDRLSSPLYLEQHPADMLPGNLSLLAQFGDDLKAAARTKFALLVAKTVMYACMTGERRLATKLLRVLLEEKPVGIEGPILAALIVAGPRASRLVYRTCHKYRVRVMGVLRFANCVRSV